MPPWALVTPASRGLGLELARRLLRTTTLPVVATARGSTDETVEAILASQRGEDEGDHGIMRTEGDESRLTVLKLDVCDEVTIASASARCASLFPIKPTHSNEDSTPSHLHLAFAVPGILYPEKSPSQLDAAQIHQTFATNTIGPLLLLKHFSPFLPRKTSSSLPISIPSSASPSNENAQDEIIPNTHATWATMSARVGSISDNNLGGWYSYRASKTAVNQITKTFDNYLKATAGNKAMAIALHPGTVKTGLSKEFWGNVKGEKLFSVGFAADRLVGVVRDMGVEGRGRCWDWEGREVPP